MAPRQSHGLGFGNGSIIDYGDGIIEYRQTESCFQPSRSTSPM